MINLFIVIAASIAAGLLSLSVALFLLRSEKLSAKLIKYGTPFAAGVLLIIAFRDLLPEAIVEDGADVLNSALGAILIFFLIEKGFKSFHHHHEEDIVEQKDTTQGWLFVIGDVFHNLIDGISLGGAFLIGRETGLIATVALISHDIPLEVGEFGNQLRAGFTKRQTIFRNIVSGLTTVIGAILTYQVGGDLDLPMGYLYGGIAGFFIYIALSDIVPIIHSSEKARYGLQTGFLLFGLIFGGTVSALAHEYIDVGHNHGEHVHHDDHDEEDNHDEEGHHDEDDHDEEDNHDEGISSKGCLNDLSSLNSLEAYVVAINSPYAGEIISGDYLVSGCSSAFEGTVVWELLDIYGVSVDSGFTNGGSFSVDKFEFLLETEIYKNGKYFLEVFETDPSNGESSLKLDGTVLPIYIYNETSASTTTTVVEVEKFFLSVTEGVPEKLQIIEVKLGTKSILEINSSIRTELHIHGYDLYIDVQKDETLELAFDFNIAGEFEIEDHNSGYEIARIRVNP
jgi:zinc and cadmium transporter